MPPENGGAAMVMSDWTWIASPAVALLGFWWASQSVKKALRRDVDILATKMAPLEAAAVRIGDKLEILIVNQGRHDERIQAIERDRESFYPREKRR